eukprot:CAMPEP_0177277470 /NCGR_PEP_ID=MMETSP0367-20130122/68807_1 /TAXON_ID=447022 ORGANISM="Scrippsiella hangoei-like, Strain SHHI-4" /NCGR_SAMPLE_ID=MMETSP0367 /ASSEMBLY_ACC=CAM_ASM_000362 /LENGTH=127 /DNA_ID=CAMNT_0018734053 /DNA_START=150 /DNA_END=531 /DNA_ORIENTATION=-
MSVAESAQKLSSGSLDRKVYAQQDMARQQERQGTSSLPKRMKTVTAPARPRREGGDEKQAPRPDSPLEDACVQGFHFAIVDGVRVAAAVLAEEVGLELHVSQHGPLLHHAAETQHTEEQGGRAVGHK